jgi:hypothetical protein
MSGDRRKLWTLVATILGSTIVFLDGTGGEHCCDPRRRECCRNGSQSGQGPPRRSRDGPYDADADDQQHDDVDADRSGRARSAQGEADASRQAEHPHQTLISLTPQDRPNPHGRRR